MLKIRLATVADADELCRLNDLFNGAGSNTVRGVADSLTNNNREIICVAADGSRLAGFCCGQIQSSMCYPYDYCVITELFVMDEFRRQRVGRRLLAATEAEFCKRGITHFHLSTEDENAAALALYRSCGYDETSVMLEKDMEK